MTQELFNNILAIIGVITGLSGLFISLYILHKEKVKLKVYHPANTENSAYIGFNSVFEGYDSGFPKYKHTPYILFAWLRITNQSKSPTTILEMSLKLPTCEESVLYSQTSDDYVIAIDYTKDEIGNIDIKSSFDIKNVKKPPIAIASFATIEGYFFFRDLKIDNQETLKAVLKIKTPQGITKHNVTFTPRYPTYFSY